LFGYIYDPDLIRIGDKAVLGSGSAISAHSITTTPTGGHIYATAPITIGDRAVIGGEARVALGVNIGDDAVIEPFSNVVAFTQIPAGEVWGGNPALFVRQRFQEQPVRSQSVAVPLPADASTLEVGVRRAVAATFNLPLEAVHSSFAAQDCVEWDSLGQMAVASALNNRFGIDIPAAQCFQLQSIPAIVALLSHSIATQPKPPDVLPDDPELLPLLDHMLATRLLAERGPIDLPAGNRSLKVVIAATFTAEPLASSLALWSNAFGIKVDVEFAGFNQVQQTLLSPDSLFCTNVSGLNIVLTRPEDLLAGLGTQSSESLLTAVERFAREHPGSLVVANLPAVVSPFAVVDAQAVDILRSAWKCRLSAIPGVQLLDFAAIIEVLGATQAAKADGELIARAPYSAKVYTQLGIAIARLARSQRFAPAKVLALDADGVLWGNILGEDGFNGIQLGTDPPGRSYQLFQHWVKELKSRGVLVVVVSRNELDDVQQVFDTHPGMILKSSDIAAWRVNWQSKSQNLKELARELNLGLNSFVFVDDDPANRLEMQANAPEVTVVPLPMDPAEYCRTLARLWRFDAPSITAEDGQRTEMMQQEHGRKNLQEQSIDLQSYLTSLQLRVTMRIASPDDLPRVAQLTQKTNQFNLSLRRRSEVEIRSLGSDHVVCVVEAADHLGDYGLVGVCILRKSASSPEIVELDTLLMSCRALGRGVEDATLHGLLQLVRSLDGQRLGAEFISGPRNQPIRDFLLRTEFGETKTGRYEISADGGDLLPVHINWTGPLDTPVRALG